jgi:site-specific DNA recombinase
MRPKAVIAARLRIDSEDCSVALENQVKELKKYAAVNHFAVVKVLALEGKGAADLCRVLFEYLRHHPDVRVVVVEKTDRICGDLHSFALLENLIKERDLEIHFVKNGNIMRKATKSQDKLVQGIRALLARNYIQNLQEEIRKGQLIKAERGQYPGRAPFGYSHRNGSIIPHPAHAVIVRKVFQIFASIRFDLGGLQEAVFNATGRRFTQRRLEEILICVFHCGLFRWNGVEYMGIHPPLVDRTTFENVQRRLCHDTDPSTAANGPDGTVAPENPDEDNNAEGAK